MISLDLTKSSEIRKAGDQPTCVAKNAEIRGILESFKASKLLSLVVKKII